jgi:hypothetical protein
MTAIVLPDLNQKTLDDLRERVSRLSDLDLSKLDLPKIEMPALQDVGKTADQAIDRLLGRSRTPVWPWVAAGIGLVAVVGAIAAWFTFLRRPALTGLGSPSPEQTFTADLSTAENDGMTSQASMDGDLRTEELVASLRTTPYPIEEA